DKFITTDYLQQCRTIRIATKGDLVIMMYRKEEAK
ncbi:DUF4752 family protein, partial [Escherichia coli]|nr:DUF4752 family protein [Escherichia coli]EMC2151423.1 DUF4752 family protein [Escherichia coli]